VRGTQDEVVSGRHQSWTPDNICVSCHRPFTDTLVKVTLYAFVVSTAVLWSLLWPPCGIGQTIIFSFCAFFLLFSFFFFSSPNISRRRLDAYHTSTHGVALSVILGCRSETCSTWLAENTVHKNSPKIHHLHTIVQLCQAISSQLRHILTIGKKLKLSSNISSRCPHNMNFGPLAGEIGPVVWGTPANFNCFRVLAALLHGTPAVGVSQTLQR